MVQNSEKPGAMLQKTILSEVSFSGIGLHSGDECGVLIQPAPVDSGIVFVPSFPNAKIPASPENVIATNHGTVLGDTHGASVSTVEHLMAALALCEIDNARIEVFGCETPILDGSAAEFVAGIQAVGTRRQGQPRREIIVKEPVVVSSGNRFIRIEPFDGFVLDVSISFEDCMIGRQSLSLEVNDADCLQRLASSRTFCQVHEVEQLRRAGLIRGGSLNNSIVVDGDRLLNDEALRDPQEFALHKALDLIGDLYLVGGPIRGRVVAEKPGHDLNTRMARELSRQFQAIELPDLPMVVAG